MLCYQVADRRVQQTAAPLVKESSKLLHQRKIFFKINKYTRNMPADVLRPTNEGSVLQFSKAAQFRYKTKHSLVGMLSDWIKAHWSYLMLV